MVVFALISGTATSFLRAEEGEHAGNRSAEVDISLDEAETLAGFDVKHPSELLEGFELALVLASVDESADGGFGPTVTQIWVRESDRAWIELLQGPQLGELGDSSPHTLGSLDVQRAIHPPNSGRDFGIYSVFWSDSENGYIVTMPDAKEVHSNFDQEAIAQSIIETLRPFDGAE